MVGQKCAIPPATKTITFKHFPLPINIENFLENHISSNRGAALIHSTTNNSQQLIDSSINNKNTVNSIRESLQK